MAEGRSGGGGEGREPLSLRMQLAGSGGQGPRPRPGGPLGLLRETAGEAFEGRGPAGQPSSPVATAVGRSGALNAAGA